MSPIRAKCPLVFTVLRARIQAAVRRVLGSVLGVDEFVNADVIAEGLAGSNSWTVSLSAGRLMSLRLRELAEQGADFAFETNLASRSLAPFIRDLQRRSYETRLYLVSPSLRRARDRSRGAACGGGGPQRTR